MPFMQTNIVLSVVRASRAQAEVRKLSGCAEGPVKR